MFSISKMNPVQMKGPVGAAHLLQDSLTAKSDSIGRDCIYESSVEGDNLLKLGTPSSFNNLINELQRLGLDVRTENVFNDLFDKN